MDKRYLALEGDDIDLVGVLGDLKRGFEQPQQLPLLQVQPHRDVLGPVARHAGGSGTCKPLRVTLKRCCLQQERSSTSR